MSDICTHSSSGSTPKKGNSAYYAGGTIPWLRTQDVKFNEIYEATAFITETAVKEIPAKWIPENCIIVAISGASAGRCAINKIPLTTNQHCLNIEIDSDVAILDSFDSLCNDLTSGLSAEIEALQKQYEYYRDKLLTFQPAE